MFQRIQCEANSLHTKYLGKRKIIFIFIVFLILFSICLIQKFDMLLYPEYGYV